MPGKRPPLRRKLKIRLRLRLSKMELSKVLSTKTGNQLLLKLNPSKEPLLS